jgi:MFS family permease
MNQEILHRLMWARALRAFGDGFISLLLPVYLTVLGMDPFQIGVIATGTLLGSGVLTLLVGLHAWRFQYRTLLLAAAALMAGTGVGFATIAQFWPLLLIAVVGTINPSSGDASIFHPLEHAILSRSVEDKRRTAAFARYSLVGALVAALGSLAAAVPNFIAGPFGLDQRSALQGMFLLYALLGVASALLYRKMPRVSAETVPVAHSPLKGSKKTVYTLAALFSLDSFGSGFIVQSMLVLWLFEKYQLSTALAGTIFFWTGVLTAFSYLVAVRIADRIGLVYTMVFTHLPSSILLIMVPFAPSLTWAIALLLTRAALSQMDVPTRSSYVMAIVPPEERAAAASITAVSKTLASAIGPLLAGYLFSLSSFGWPLVVGGVLKIVYDLLLLRMFGTVRPPEEQAQAHQ